MLSGRKDRRELLETLRRMKSDSVAMSHCSGRGKKKGFGFWGFSLTSSFHKAGELGSWQKERRGKGWSAIKYRSEE